jgi:hypothetical protein
MKIAIDSKSWWLTPWQSVFALTVPSKVASRTWVLAEFVAGRGGVRLRDGEVPSDHA